MATNKQLKFFKGASAPAAPAAGMIWFCTDDRTIRVYTGTEWEKYAGLVNANWNGTDKLLTITNAAGVETKLDLSDCASAKDITAKLTTINNTLTSHDGRITTAQGAAEAAQAHSEGVASDLAAEVKLRGEEITRVEGLISAEAATARAAEQANAKAAKDADDKAAAAQTYAEGVNTALGQEVTRATGKENELAGKISALETAVGAGGSVETQIVNKISELDATVGSQTVADGKHVAVEVVETDGKLTGLTVVESDIASAQALADEIANRGVAEQGLSNRIEALAAAETGRVSKLEKQVAALNAATHFEGKVEFDPSAEGATTEGYEAGDIVIYYSKEYIFDGAAWIELGDTTAESNRISALEGLVGETSVDAQIDAKIGALDATVGEATVAEGKHVAVQVVEVDGVLTALTIAEKDIASAAKLSEIEGEVDLNTGAVADHKTRIEALEATSNALGTTYVKVSDYNSDKDAFEQKHSDLQGEIDAAEGRLDVVEGDIATIKDEQTTQNAAIEAAAAKGQQGIDDAAAALAKAEEKVATVTAGDHISVGNDAKNPVVSVNVTGQIAEDNTGLVNGGAIFNELCWVEFE